MKFFLSVLSLFLFCGHSVAEDRVSQVLQMTSGKPRWSMRIRFSQPGEPWEGKDYVVTLEIADGGKYRSFPMIETDSPLLTFDTQPCRVEIFPWEFRGPFANGKRGSHYLLRDRDCQYQPAPRKKSLIAVDSSDGHPGTYWSQFDSRTNEGASFTWKNNYEMAYHQFKTTELAPGVVQFAVEGTNYIAGHVTIPYIYTERKCKDPRQEIYSLHAEISPFFISSTEVRTSSRSFGYANENILPTLGERFAEKVLNRVKDGFSWWTRDRFPIPGRVELSVPLKAFVRASGQRRQMKAFLRSVGQDDPTQTDLYLHGTCSFESDLRELRNGDASWTDEYGGSGPFNVQAEENLCFTARDFILKHGSKEIQQLRSAMEKKRIEVTQFYSSLDLSLLGCESVHIEQATSLRVSAEFESDTPRKRFSRPLLKIKIKPYAGYGLECVRSKNTK